VSLSTGLGFFGSAAGDTLSQIENLNGSNFADTLIGDGLANTLTGFNGNDLLNGGLGNDLLIGGLGADTLIGGGGLDTFDFNSVSESPPGFGFRDVITDFVGNGAAAGDVLNFSTIDANTLLVGDQAFSFIGGAAFSAAGQLRYSRGVVQGSTDGDLFAEFEVALSGAPALVGADIVL
jgi:serralysin